MEILFYIWKKTEVLPLYIYGARRRREEGVQVVSLMYMRGGRGGGGGGAGGGGGLLGLISKAKCHLSAHKITTISETHFISEELDYTTPSRIFINWGGREGGGRRGGG